MPRRHMEGQGSPKAPPVQIQPNITSCKSSPVVLTELCNAHHIFSLPKHLFTLSLFFLVTKADGWLVIDNTADIDFLSCCETNGIYVKITVTQFQVTANSLASLEIVVSLVVLQPAHFSAAVSSKLRNQEKKKCCFSKIDTRKSD